MELKNKTILIISPENWGTVFLSKHHYALELSKSNKVWFLNARGHRNNKKAIEHTIINENLTIINYYNLFFGFGKIPFIITSIINYYLSKKIKNNIGKIDVVWSFEHAKFFNLKLFDAIYTIFHPVDHIPSFIKYKTKLAESADVILSVSQEILATIASSKPKHFINHGVSHVDPIATQKLQLSINTSKVNIAYVGNINMYCIDIKNLMKIIRHNSNCDFHFIGPIEKSNIGDFKENNNYNSLSLFDNVYFHGIIQQKELVTSIKCFDILISCYDYKKHPIRLSNSHKILEYLSTGKVLVSNYFPTYKDTSSSIIKMISDNDELPLLIEKIASEVDNYNTLELMKKRIGFAKENTYAKQLKKIELILSTKI